MSTRAVTDDSFQSDVLNADGPVLVDFWAEWCGPCKQIAPALEEIAREMGEKLTIAKLNIDDNPKTTAQYNVRGIPTLLIFKGGQVVAQKMGALPKGKILEWINQSAA
jgi:thioredoxin 1